MDEFVSYWCFCWRVFTVSRWTPYVSCTSWKNCQAETDALSKNVVQYRGEAGLSQHPSWMKCLKISISTNVVSTKWYHLGINAFFCNRSQDLFKRFIDNVSFRAILGLRRSARFSLKRQNVIFICIIKCKQTVYHQNKVKKIRIQTDCCTFFPLHNN